MVNDPESQKDNDGGGGGKGRFLINEFFVLMSYVTL